MQTLTVNICVKEPKDYINYHPSSFKVNRDVNFPIEILVGEVMQEKKHVLRKYSKVIKSFIGTTISFLALSSKSMASQLNQPAQQIVTSGLPQDLVEPMMELIRLAIGGSVLLTVILLIAAGIMRQFRKKKEAIEWTNDIIRGFIQVLISVPLIFVLYYVVTKLLGSFSTFLTPF